MFIRTTKQRFEKSGASSVEQAALYLKARELERESSSMALSVLKQDNTGADANRDRGRVILSAIVQEDRYSARKIEAHHLDYDPKSLSINQYEGSFWERGYGTGLERVELKVQGSLLRDRGDFSIHKSRESWGSQRETWTLTRDKNGILDYTHDLPLNPGRARDRYQGGDVANSWVMGAAFGAVPVIGGLFSALAGVVGSTTEKSSILEKGVALGLGVSALAVSVWSAVTLNAGGLAVLPVAASSLAAALAGGYAAHLEEMDKVRSHEEYLEELRSDPSITEVSS